MTSASAQTAPGLDTLFMASGEKSVGKLAGFDAQTFRMQKPLPAPPGAPAGAPPMFATVTVPRANVVHIEFGADEARSKLFKDATPAQLPQIEAVWKQFEPWLPIAKSPAGNIGLVYGDMLLRSGDAANAQKALDLFTKIEKETWNQDDIVLAKQGRLRAMVATGNAKDAIDEALALAKISEDPAVLIEAKYILAEAADKGLRKLLDENPRWEEDILVIPERHRLYNEALDLYLFPSLFFGSESEPAARGLWGAVGVYQFTDATQDAVECARDLAALYPGTRYAKQAQDFLNSLPESQKHEDYEKDARKETN
ncbi:MAG: hypothetical protein ACOYMS_10170 [Terrimicrobiaceae bacterium]